MDNTNSTPPDERDGSISLGNGINIVHEEENDDITLESIDESGERTESAKDIVKALREKMKVLQNERQEYLEGWQRLKADFANYKKRESDEKGEFIKFAREGLISELIPVLESFQLAFANKEAWEKVDKNWRVGVEYIHQQLMTVMNENGLIILNPNGEVFDPNLHTSIGTIETHEEKKIHHIAEVVQPGYSLNGKLIRSPRVKVFAEVTSENTL